MDILKNTEIDLEARLSSLISSRVREETVLLRQWATNLVREKVNEDSRSLK